MDQALKKEILFELEFLLKNHKNLNEDIGDWASQKYKEFKEEGAYLGKELGLTAKNLAQGDTSRLKELGKAFSLGAEDIHELFEKDPVGLLTNIIDVVSLFEPTGIADIINSGIYLARNEKLPATISAITGGLQLVGYLSAIATAGATAPLLVVTKIFKAIRLSKNISKFFEICKTIFSFSSAILSKLGALVTKMPGLKSVYDLLSGVLKRMGEFLSKPRQFSDFDKLFEYVFGSGNIESATKIIDSKAFKQAAEKSLADKALHKTSQAAGAGINTSTALESGADIKERQEKEKKVRASKVCENNSCDTIYYNKESKQYIDSKTGKPDTYFNMAIQFA